MIDPSDAKRKPTIHEFLLSRGISHPGITSQRLAYSRGVYPAQSIQAYSPVGLRIAPAIYKVADRPGSGNGGLWARIVAAAIRLLQRKGEKA